MGILVVGVFPALQRTLRVDRLVPGGVHRVRAAEECASGKGVNVVRALRALGVPASAAGFQGGATGERLADHLAAEGFPWEGVLTAAPTRICQTVLDEAAGTATELVEEARPPSGEEWARLDALVSAGIPRCSALVITGNLPPGAPAAWYARWAGLAAAAGRPVLVDTGGEALRAVLPQRPTLVKPNAKELAETLGRDSGCAESLPASARALVERGARWAVVTDGPSAAVLAGAGGTALFRPPAVRAVNPIGAGDVLTAALAAALAAGRDVREALPRALACASASCLDPRPGRFDPAVADRLLSG